MAKFIKIILARAVVFGLSLFYSWIVIVANLIRRIIKGNTYFVVKERSLPPICLQDASYGRHSYLKLKDIKLHYVENGDRSKPLMLFVHGFPEFWFSWRYQLKEFAATHWVVALDMRGYGDSDKPSKVSSYRMDLLEQDICDFVKALNRDKCILVAHDWGGVVAWNVATKYPALVEKFIILNSPHPATFRGRIRSSIGQFLKSWYIFFFQMPYVPEWMLHTDDLAIFERMFVNEEQKTTIDPDDLEGYKYTYSRKGAWTPPINYYRANFNAADMFNQENKGPSVSKVIAPTLIIWGENDIALSRDLAEAARPYCNSLTIKYIPKGNHFVQQDKPSEVNAIIAEYLNN